METGGIAPEGGGAVAQQVRFFDWSEPVLRQAAAFLAGQRPGRLLDLNDTLILVPTLHAGRRLRETLALDAAGRSGAVLPGRVDTPSALFRPASGRAVADASVEALVWSAVLGGIRPTDFPALWPASAAFPDCAAALRFSRPFSRLRRLLCEEKWTVRQVAGSISRSAEAARWNDLARLEDRYLARLTDAGWLDGCRERFRTAEAGPPAGVRRVVLLFTPDPPPLALQVLERWAETLEVVVCVHAPESERAAFDAWGRPRPDVWAERILDLEADEIHLCAGPREQARMVAGVLSNLPEDQRRSAAIGMPDPDLAPYLEAELESLGLPVYDPEGRPAGLRPPVATALGLLRAAAERDAVSLGDLMRDPDVLAWLTREPNRALDEWNQLRMRNLPATVEDVLRVLRGKPDYPVLEAGWIRLIPALDGLRGPGRASGLRKVLAQVYSSRMLTAHSPRDERFSEAARSLRDTLSTLESVEKSPLASDSAALTRVLSDALREIRLHPEREPGAIDLLGWLELHWEDAPLLVITGLTEGCVPESVTSDPFLPGTAREKLGMRDNAFRFARDLYLLTAMGRSRVPGARKICLGAADSSGEPLKPSRLLFRCAPERLPERALQLFAQPVPAAPSPPWMRAWTLKPPALDQVKLPERLGVTALAGYLQCPFRFFLKHVLGMQPEDSEPRELDGARFGTACHHALEQFGADTDLRDSRDKNRIEAFLKDQVDRWLTDHFGSRIGLALRVQRSVLHSRMAAFAGIQVREREEGWCIVEMERKVSLQTGALRISGRVDRVDWNERTGEHRVLDYKTGDKAEEPRKMHMRKAREDDPAWIRAPGETAWVQLQLPLYARMLRGVGLGVLHCGYFNLPKAATAAGVVLWEGFAPDEEASATACAEEIARRVGRSVFWPPAERVAYDDFTTLFHKGVRESLDPDWVREAERRAGEVLP